MKVAKVQSTIEATSFLLSVIILHEYVHYGDNLDGVDFLGEEGKNYFVTAAKL